MSDIECAICGFRGDGGLGYWACHADGDDTPVCRGKCWRTYWERKKALAVLESLGRDESGAWLRDLDGN